MGSKKQAVPVRRRYFQFPLCALQSIHHIPSRLSFIVSYCCVEVGRHLYQRSAQGDQPRKQLENWRLSHLDWNDKHAVAIAYAEAGKRYLGVLIMENEEIILQHSYVASFVDNFERKYGTDARLRIVRDWLLEALNGDGMAYDEFAVLVAIYSKIGQKRGPVRISQDEIWRRAHGFKSAAVAHAENLGPTVSPTRRRVRTIIERISLRRFFARVTFGRRHTYYSNRMTSAQLSDAVFAMKTRVARAKHSNSCLNADLTNRIRAERRRLVAPPPEIEASDPPL